MTADLWINLAGFVISALSLIIVAVIGREQRVEHGKTEAAREREEERAKVRETESRLSMDLMEATSELSDVIAIAVSGGHVNGNVEAARERAKVARENYHDFIHTQAAKNVTKL